LSPKDLHSAFLSRSVTSSLSLLGLLSTKILLPRPADATTTEESTAALQNDHLPFGEIKTAIESGQPYVIPGFVSEQVVASLRSDIRQLVDSGAFAPSGLTNRAKDAQNFGKNDRSVSPINLHARGDSSSSSSSSASLSYVGDKLFDLRHRLADLLGRPSMKDGSLSHESYFSRSLPGSSLRRHLDEHHEETKGMY
jgi:hypothetical protein